MANHPMKANPYSARIVRVIKPLNYDEDNLNEEIIALMCEDSYIRAYDNESDMFEFLHDCYQKAKQKYERLKNSFCYNCVYLILRGVRPSFSFSYSKL